MLKIIKEKKFVDSVLNPTFWEECGSIVRMTEPLVRVLRIVDSDDRPAMGYLYEAIHYPFCKGRNVEEISKEKN